mmetsp:Transcript_39098/g.84151  ORF Transcript_39098/g.84151 Transcript_39098/m.84151 type:complete len:350 (+) Transcript_39098:66-1115(+)
MSMVRARPFSSRDDLDISPLRVRGQGVSAVAVECICKGGEVELPGRFVGKFYKVPSKREEPPALASHEFRMLEAVKGCPHVVQTLGLFHLPIHNCLKHFLNVEGHCAAPGVPLPWDSQESAQEDDMPTQRLCALFMEKCDYSLQDFAFFRYTESEAAFVCRSVLSALSHLHARGIVHRDVKPANILVGSGGEKVLLGDFGLAAFLEVETNTVSRNGCGTHGFLAPECLEKNEFCEKSDLFALRAVLYQLLFRTCAFVKETKIQSDIATRLGDLPLIPCGRPAGKSDDGCHLIRWLLQRDAYDRPSAVDALDHHWFEAVENPQETLKAFVSEQHWRNDDDDEDEWPMVRR